MAPTAHTSQVPVDLDLANGAGITLGVRFTVAAEIVVDAVPFYSPGTVSGTFTAGLWQSTTDDDPNGTGTGTLLGSGSLGSGAITPSVWTDVPLAASVTLSPGLVYTAGVHSSSGRFARTNGAFASAEITNGGVTLLQAGSDPHPPALGSLVNGVFTEGTALAYPATAFGLADYFIDVRIFEDDPDPEPVVDTPASSVSAVAAYAAANPSIGVPVSSTTILAALAASTSTVGEG